MSIYHILWIDLYKRTINFIPIDKQCLYTFLINAIIIDRTRFSVNTATANNYATTFPTPNYK